MFTGIVEDIGAVVKAENTEGDLAIEVESEKISSKVLALGESISVSGVCLTVVKKIENRLLFDLSNETLSRTNFAQLKKGDRVNLELAMSAGDRFGGHFVSGHIDGVAILYKKEKSSRSTILSFWCDSKVAPFVSEKGSVTLDGVSLTINNVEDNGGKVMFSVNLIPHTLSVTTLGLLEIDSKVHIEVDMIARYLNRLNQVNSGK